MATSILDNVKEMVRMDKSGMLDRCAELPDQCRQGWDWGLNWKVPASWKGLSECVVLGMGGSAIGADLAVGLMGSKLKHPILVNRDYALPGWVGKKSLVLVCSYSGNTEETLSAAHQAAQRGARLAAITSGGKLARWAKLRRIPLVQIPQGLPPRGAVGFMVFVPLGLLAKLGWIPRKGVPVKSAANGLQTYIARALAPEVRTGSNPAKRIAQRLYRRLPILYGAASGWEGVTFRWRTQLEENSKTVAAHHIFPEATHNEISGWVHPKGSIRQSAALFFMDPAVHPRTRRRMEFTGRIIQRQGAQRLNITVPGRDPFARLLKLVALGDFVSVYLAFLYGEDPSPVVRVEALKKYMKKQ